MFEDCLSILSGFGDSRADEILYRTWDRVSGSCEPTRADAREVRDALLYHGSETAAENLSEEYCL